uniref:Ovule protein n=1 Tax=Angiostrongylus cantonensis TaxID=6313 RepID=A0A0K0CWE0_ANGCA
SVHSSSDRSTSERVQYSRRDQFVPDVFLHHSSLHSCCLVLLYTKSTGTHHRLNVLHLCSCSHHRLASTKHSSLLYCRSVASQDALSPSLSLSLPSLLHFVDIRIQFSAYELYLSFIIDKTDTFGMNSHFHFVSLFDVFEFFFELVAFSCFFFE